MLERDYIMRLIREFMAALQRLLDKKEVEDRREELKKLYDQYVGPYTLYYNAGVDEVMLAMGGMVEKERMYKLEILAELYFAEADTVSNPERDRLLEKAFQLFDYLDNNSRVYSMERKKKMQEISNRLNGNK